MNIILETIKIGFGIAVGYELGKKTVAKIEKIYIELKAKGTI